MPQVFRGAVAPERLLVRIRNHPAGPALDFTEVTAAELRILDARGVVWGTSIVSAAPDVIEIAHDFAAGDVPAPGLMRLIAYLTTLSGVRRSMPIGLEVM